MSYWLSYDLFGNRGIGPNASAPAYTLFVDGTAGKPGGGAWINSSDRRLKQDIKDYGHGLDELLRIRPVTFHYNELSATTQFRNM